VSFEEGQPKRRVITVAVAMVLLIFLRLGLFARSARIGWARSAPCAVITFRSTPHQGRDGIGLEAEIRGIGAQSQIDVARPSRIS